MIQESERFLLDAGGVKQRLEFIMCGRPCTTESVKIKIRLRRRTAVRRSDNGNGTDEGEDRHSAGQEFPQRCNFFLTYFVVDVVRLPDEGAVEFLDHLGAALGDDGRND